MYNTSLVPQIYPAELDSLLKPEGQLVPVYAKDLARFSQAHISSFCLQNAVYQLPTWELIDFLDDLIGERSAIEIGAGNGAVGRALDIHLTDSYLQQSNLPGVKEHYDLMGQPRINYPSDVEKCLAISAIMKYRPQVVLGCWITELYRPHLKEGNMYGVDEIKLSRLVDTYIHVGNDVTHGRKTLLGKFRHREVKATWLYSRSLEKEKNIIYIFNFQR